MGRQESSKGEYVIIKISKKKKKKACPRPTRKVEFCGHILSIAGADDTIVGAVFRSVWIMDYFIPGLAALSVFHVEKEKKRGHATSHPRKTQTLARNSDAFISV